MKPGYFNTELTDYHARVTFIGRDAAGRSRRPVVELDAHDLADLVTTARDFRNFQQARAKEFDARANIITTALKESTT